MYGHAERHMKLCHQSEEGDNLNVVDSKVTYQYVMF